MSESFNNGQKTLFWQITFNLCNHFLSVPSGSSYHKINCPLLSQPSCAGCISVLLAEVLERLRNHQLSRCRHQIVESAR
jgi:hypothetical protein